MLAAMFSATMSSLSGLFNVHAAVVSKDIYQRLVAPRAGERELLVVGWIATFGVGATMTALAMGMAAKGQSIFAVMLTFNTIISLAYGPPALLGLVVKRTPAWSGLLTFAVGLVLGCYGAFVGDWSLIRERRLSQPEDPPLLGGPGTDAIGNRPWKAEQEQPPQPSERRWTALDSCAEVPL